MSKMGKTMTSDAIKKRQSRAVSAMEPPSSQLQQVQSGTMLFSRPDAAAMGTTVVHGTMVDSGTSIIHGTMLQMGTTVLHDTGTTVVSGTTVLSSSHSSVPESTAGLALASMATVVVTPGALRAMPKTPGKVLNQLAGSPIDLVRRSLDGVVCLLVSEFV
jgi:predicted anti-sigma-YlaC factor YlaD